MRRTHYLAALAQACLTLAEAVPRIIIELAAKEMPDEIPKMGFEVVQTLDPGALIDLLLRGVVFRTEAVRILQAREKLFGIAHFVNAKFEFRHITGKQLDLYALARRERPRS